MNTNFSSSVVAFYSHSTKNSETAKYAALSQFYHACFEVSGLVFPTAEHYMMYAKAVLFCDFDLAKEIQKAHSAYAAMELGRLVSSFREEIWSSRRRDIVFAGNFAKFTQNTDCAKVLISTSPAHLVFASPVDQVWGTGLSIVEHRSNAKAAWPGLNLLGEILMEIRSQL